MKFLKTNTATRITVGPFLDKTDGITPETALTVTNEKLTLVVDDGGVPTLVLDTAPTASGGNNDMVHVTNDDAGFYDLELAAANVNYVGRAMLALTDAANHCPVFHEFMILSAQAYDALCGTGNFSADVIAISGDTTAADNCELMFDGAGYAGGTTKLKVDIETIKTQAVTCGAGVTVLASVGTAGTSTAQTGDSYAIINGASGNVAIKTQLADIHDTDLPAVKTDTAEIKTMTDKIGTVTNTGGTATIGAILGDFANSALVTRVADIHTDVADVHTDVGTVLTDTNAIHVHVGAIDGHIQADYTATEKAAIDLLDDANGLINIHDTLDTAVTAIGDVHATDLPAVMTMLTNIHDTDLPAVKTDTTAILADTNELQTDWANGGRLDLILDAASAPTAAAVADAVWDELLSGHAGAGSAGLALSTASSGGVDPSVLADAIWDEALSGHSTAGTSGKKLTDLINADLSGVATAANLATVDTVVDGIKVTVDNIHDTDLPAVKTDTAAILVDTGITLDALIQDIPTVAEFNARSTADPATQTLLSTVAGYLDTEIAAIKAKTDNLPASPANESTLTTIASYIDTEVSAIKAKTDNLPSDPADQSAVEAAITAAHATTNGKIDVVDDYIDTEIAAIKAKTDLIPAAPAAVGDIPTTAQIKTALEVAGGHLAEILADTGTTLDGKITTIDTVVDAVKVQTDKLTFTVANQVDSNLQSVNDKALTGDGSALTPWGPA